MPYSEQVLWYKDGCQDDEQRQQDLQQLEDWITGCGCLLRPDSADARLAQVRDIAALQSHQPLSSLKTRIVKHCAAIISHLASLWDWVHVHRSVGSEDAAALYTDDCFHMQRSQRLKLLALVCNVSMARGLQQLLVDAPCLCMLSQQERCRSGMIGKAHLEVTYDVLAKQVLGGVAMTNLLEIFRGIFACMNDKTLLLEPSSCSCEAILWHPLHPLIAHQLTVTLQNCQDVVQLEIPIQEQKHREQN